MPTDDELGIDDEIDLDALLAEIAADGGWYDFFGPELEALTAGLHGDGIDDTVGKTLERIGMVSVYWRNGDGDPILHPNIEAVCGVTDADDFDLEDLLGGVDGVRTLTFECAYSSGHTVHMCLPGRVAEVAADLARLLARIAADESDAG